MPCFFGLRVVPFVQQCEIPIILRQIVVSQFSITFTDSSLIFYVACTKCYGSVN